MIKVTYGHNVDRKHDIVDENTVVKKFLEDHGVDYTRGVMHLDGASMNPGDINKTFAELNVKNSCYLLSIVKADNAV